MMVSIHAKCRGHLKRTGAITVLLAVAFLVEGCAETPKQFAGPSPADPSVRIAATAYRPVIVPYDSIRPAEPGPWRQQNEKAAPSSGPQN